jgi:hypothetical protein
MFDGEHHIAEDAVAATTIRLGMVATGPNQRIGVLNLPLQYRLTAAMQPPRPAGRSRSRYGQSVRFSASPPPVDAMLRIRSI